MTTTGHGASSPPPLLEADVVRLLTDALCRDAGDDGRPVLSVRELPLAGTRADHAVLTADAIELIEVKTASDRLSRLRRQAATYAQVADRCGVVVAPIHLDGAVELIPPWWAVTVVDGDGLRPVRPGAPNPAPDPQATAHLLWRAELTEAVAQAGQEGGAAGLDRQGLAAVLAAALADDPPRLRQIVRSFLLARRWVDLAEPVGHVRTVRPTAPSRRAKITGRVRAKGRAGTPRRGGRRRARRR